jgi:hypothetical protein
MRLCEAEGSEDVPDGVVDAEGGLQPGEEGEEDCVAREEADEGLELGAEVAWAVGPGERCQYKRAKGGWGRGWLTRVWRGSRGVARRFAGGVRGVVSCLGCGIPAPARMYARLRGRL